MVIVRLVRSGRKKLAFFHIHVADQRCAATGRYLERVGYYDPSAKDLLKGCVLKLEKIDEWVKKGAKLSDTVKQLISRYKKLLEQNTQAPKEPEQPEEKKPAKEKETKAKKPAAKKPAAKKLAAKKPAATAKKAKPAAKKAPAKK
ncbi:30S ribosomal protein S16 [Gammaproteobacteria bacterium]|nr:30S ribosomal protein S16 [Gammaproteobacteria bacterium]